MFEELEILKKKYLYLQKKILDNSENLRDINFLKKINYLEKIMFIYNKYNKLNSDLEKIKNILIQSRKKDKEYNEIITLAKEEEKKLENKIQQTVCELKKKIFHKEEEEHQGTIMEIKGAAGGNESHLFVADLFRTYMKYAESKNWKTEIINFNNGLNNGISSVEVIIYGPKSYSFLKYESGIHRVQRVPSTEKQGRIHTSTVKILVIPEQKKIDLELNWSDIRIDTFNASGPGGQSVNTTKSAVRLTHIPTKISVACQIAKSQHQNKEKAFQLLKNRIYYQISNYQHKEQNIIRKKIFGKGERSEKIRTYNYSQNKIIDHRFNLIFYKLDLFMEGKINLVIEPLIEEFNKKKLKTEF
ncbi:RF-1 domain protein [Candidatus Phytoplasma oryzae]|uniref:Peptide chain release factor 1 n=1 Tax=Candidatus Phytoplasma oryzae TaxID=203274 RepID=A0A139JQZ3_9MOLU|nr:PCRF domain-containing protein [Candidatus Phytoplasma oryzae]KXT29407.1 RF-1 domain protein [Candidatus Phytoplasma oryzae]RAM57990.1 peptide chain release factor 1 [Candidatus Phytoplasma oryzae]